MGTFSFATDFFPRADELQRALEARRLIIADQEFRDRDPQAHLAALRKAAAAIDAAVERLGCSTPPELNHYLQGQSYDKAADWLRRNLSEPAE